MVRHFAASEICVASASSPMKGHRPHARDARATLAISIVSGCRSAAWTAASKIRASFVPAGLLTRHMVTDDERHRG